MHRAAEGPGEESGLEGGSAEEDGSAKGTVGPGGALGLRVVHGPLNRGSVLSRGRFTRMFKLQGPFLAQPLPVPAGPKPCVHSVIRLSKSC